MQFHLQGRARAVLHPTHRPVHKGFEFLDTIEDSLDLPPVPLPLVDEKFTLPSNQRSERDAESLVNHPPIYPQILPKSQEFVARDFLTVSPSLQDDELN